MMVPAFLRGLADAASQLRSVVEPSRRRRHQALAADFSAVAPAWRQIAEGLPNSGAAGEAWILSSISGPWAYKLELVLAMAFRADGYTPRVVAFDHDPWRRQYHSLAGIDRTDDFRLFLRCDDVPADVVDAFRRQPTASTLLALQDRRVDVGRIALSNYLYRHKFSRLDLTQPETRAEMETELVRVQRNVRAAERLLAVRRPKIAVIIEKGLSPSAELFGAAVAAGVPVFQITNAQHADDFMLKRFAYDDRHRHPFSLADDTWQSVLRMPWSAEREKEILDEFERDYREGRWFNRKFLHTGKSIKSAADVRRQLDLDPSKKTVVVFSHVLWDATFFYGKGLFEDYESWLVETVKAAVNNPRVNWVIKLHPDLVWKLKYEKARGKLRDLLVIEAASGALPPHVKLVLPETDIDTYSFFEITDVCVTVRGTIGIEMACRGVPVLTGGTGRYSGLGFTVDSDSPQAYLDRLANIEALAPMSLEERERARRYAYAVFRLRPWQMRSFEMLRRPLGETGHPLDMDVRPAPSMSSATNFFDAADIRELRLWVSGGRVDHLKALPNP